MQKTWTLGLSVYLPAVIRWANCTQHTSDLPQALVSRSTKPDVTTVMLTDDFNVQMKCYLTIPTLSLWLKQPYALTLCVTRILRPGSLGG